MCKKILASLVTSLPKRLIFFRASLKSFILKLILNAVTEKRELKGD